MALSPMPNTTFLLFVRKHPTMDQMQDHSVVLVPGTVQHRPSQTPGNEGVEVLFNEATGTEDPEYTLVGIYRTDPNGLVQDEPQRRMVRSWLKRRSTWLRGNPMAWVNQNIGYGQNAGTFSELWGIPPGAGSSVAQGARIQWVQWADEPLTANLFLTMYTTAGGQGGAHHFGYVLDQNVPPASLNSQPSFNWTIWANYRFGTGTRGVIAASEGYHFLAPVYTSWGDFTVCYPISQHDTARPRLEAMLSGGQQ